MGISNLKTNQLNQNGYSKNVLTKGKIGAIYTFPTYYTPDDCLSCEGYSLQINDYKDLYKVIGTKFNQSGDPSGTFRIPDYNVSKRFLQPGSDIGTQIDAGLPNITGSIWASSGDDMMIKHGAGVAGAITARTGTNSHNGTNSNSQSVTKGFDFNASRCSAIYGKSSTVQPPSQIVHLCIKYK